MMPDSHKLADVGRDPRVELHSSPIEDDLSSGDAKLAGVLVADAATGGEEGAAFILDVTKASVVKVIDKQLEFTTWSPADGLRVQYRTSGLDFGLDFGLGKAGRPQLDRCVTYGHHLTVGPPTEVEQLIGRPPPGRRGGQP